MLNLFCSIAQTNICSSGIQEESFMTLISRLAKASYPMCSCHLCIAFAGPKSHFMTALLNKKSMTVSCTPKMELHKR